MNFLMFLRRLELFDWLKDLIKPDPRPKISLLIPFSSDDPNRKKVFHWTMRYWQNELPDAEIVIGRSHTKPFSKTEALNNAAKRAKGRVLVILDADTYMDGSILNECADRIIENEEYHLWFVPYRRLYRLTDAITQKIIASDPKDPLRMTDPPPDEYIDHTGHNNGYGHRYGAMVMIFPRQALDMIGNFDERFVGWGGEDIALLRTLDTLYGKHKTTDNAIFHLWHPVIGRNYKLRVWSGQNKQFNSNLSSRYNMATRNPSKMRTLVEESNEYKKNKKKRQ